VEEVFFSEDSPVALLMRMRPAGGDEGDGEELSEAVRESTGAEMAMGRCLVSNEARRFFFCKLGKGDGPWPWL